MKNYGFLVFLVLLMAFTPVIQAQQTTNPQLLGGAPYVPTAQVSYLSGGQLTAQDTTNACNTVGGCVTLFVGPLDQTANLVISGTWSGTITFEAQTGNGQYTQINGPTFQAGAAVGTTTGNGGWTFDIAGKQAIRARMSTYTSGTAVIGFSSSQAQSRLGEIPLPQALSTTSTPTFAGVNQTTGNQFNGVASKVFVAANFTTSGAGTNLEPITGLSWTLPASTAVNVGFTCQGSYSQNVGQAAVSFGVQTTAAPTNLNAQGIIGTNNTTGGAFGGLAAVSTATSTAVVTGTPAAQTTNYAWTMSGFLENPSTTANVVTVNVKTATAADTITVNRDSFCSLQF